MNKILLIGSGHMGTALLTAWNYKTNNQFTVVDPIQYTKINKKFKYKVKAFKSISKIKTTSQFDVIIFAIKPQITDEVLKNFSSYKFKRTAVFVSVVAGKKINFFAKYLPKNIQFIRVMPNMPSIINEGMSCMAHNKFVTKKNRDKINSFFLKVGKTLWLKNENEINKVTAISGSGPGYIFLFIDAFEKAAIKFGLSSKNTKKIIHQTALGSILLLLSGQKSAEELVKDIAIEGGTTEAALKEFKKNNLFYKIIKKAVKAALVRAEELGK